jgi:hypothetical protein
MRGKGICYDTGFLNRGVSTRPSFVPEIVKREMRIIRDDLHCTAVRITGGDVERLKVAATYAAKAGLEVWISPFTTELTDDQLLAFLADCAEHAEKLRQHGAEVVMVTGSELSVFNQGFLPGETFEKRLSTLATHPQRRELMAAVTPRINEFLRQAAQVVRRRFGGKVTYASIHFEKVDWTPFDFVATDSAYRTRENAAAYRDSIRALVAQGKPVAIMEFGCAKYRGAADRGGHSQEIVEWDLATVTPLRLTGDFDRDETEPARYLREVLDILHGEGVDTAFWYVFAAYYLPHRTEGGPDLDMASCGVVKVLEDRFGQTYADMPWEPTAAFAALADYYRRWTER